METALEILARLGSDNPPTLAEISDAKATIARELHAAKNTGTPDLEALMALRDTYNVAVAAEVEAEAAAAEARSEIDGILADIPNPDDDTTATAEGLAAAGAENLATRALTVREAVERLGLTTATGGTVVVNEPDLSTVTHSVQIGTETRDDASWRDLAEAFAASGSRSMKTGKERIARISSQFAEDRMLSGKIGDNTRLIDSFVSPEAVAAAGGCCSLPQPIYDNPVMGSIARRIRDSLPTVGVQSRGKVEFFPAICLPQAGADLWTCEDDAAVTDDPDTWKTCTDVDCDESETATVDAIYKCLTVGRFNSRYSPEQWEGHLKAVAVAQARTAEVALFSKMRDGVTSTHTGLATGNTYLNIVNTVSRATALMRQDQRLDDVQFHFWAPEWLVAAAAESHRLFRLDKGGDAIEGVKQLIALALANEGVNVTYSLDIDDLESFQYDGALADYPSTASSVLAPEGFFSFLDGGSFDLGTEITDHDLNRQNKIAAFAESFEGLLARGCNAKALDIPVECGLTIDCAS